jgi:hypothetical protein
MNVGGKQGLLVLAEDNFPRPELQFFVHYYYLLFTHYYIEVRPNQLHART